MKEELADEIHEFLAKHGKKNANNPGEGNGPDSAMLELFAKWLRDPKKLKPTVWSDWGSGCYQPYYDEQARSWHDELIRKIDAIN